MQDLMTSSSKLANIINSWFLIIFSCYSCVYCFLRP